jgi:hypothetical protein
VPHPVLRGEGVAALDRLSKLLMDRFVVVSVDLLPPPGGGRWYFVGAVAEDFVQSSRPLDVAGSQVVFVDDSGQGIGGKPEPLLALP